MGGVGWGRESMEAEAALHFLVYMSKTPFGRAI